MSEYLLINIATIIVPLILTFEKKLKYYKKLPAVFGSIVIVGLVFITWDSIATSRGDWSFNPEYLVGVYLFGLPIEEILFFITVPYACLFLYETCLFYLKDSKLEVRKFFFLGLILVTTLLAIIFYKQYYTFTVMLFAASFLILELFFFRILFSSKLYWLFIGFSFLPFFVVNLILTFLPIVSYSSSAIWNLRVITIPLEDFFYSFVLLSYYLLVYLFLKRKWLREKTSQ
ncbi:MAG: lycopene cyclase domain-containing protein [Ignavibacteria bacterium]|nr:lycopene cyclase domain-containing protein [Ignavibacteria bacterium]